MAHSVFCPAQVAKGLFSTLTLQLLRWFTREGATEQREALALLDAVSEAVADPQDGGLERCLPCTGDSLAVQLDTRSLMAKTRAGSNFGTVMDGSAAFNTTLEVLVLASFANLSLVARQHCSRRSSSHRSHGFPARASGVHRRAA